jgi:hypothetical protein
VLEAPDIASWQKPDVKTDNKSAELVTSPRTSQSDNLEVEAVEI